MEKGQLDKYRAWFKEYVAQFYGEDDYFNANIELKDKHSWRVCSEMRFLCRELNLSTEQGHIAEAVALLHDVGRFEQFKKYRTYRDATSVNHSLLGLEVLESINLLDGIDENERLLIETAIKYHGDKQLPENLDGDTLLFAGLIRDADKLDIYYLIDTQYRKYYTDPDSFRLEIELPDVPGYSEKVVEALLAGERIEYSELKTLNDIKLLELGWIYDVNFVPTLKRIKQKKYLEGILEFLPQNSDIEKVKNRVFEYLESRLKSEA